MRRRLQPKTPPPRIVYKVYMKENYITGERTIEIDSKRIVRETEFFFFLEEPFRMDYSKRINKPDACFDLKEKLCKMILQRMKRVESLQKEINVIQKELDKL